MSPIHTEKPVKRLVLNRETLRTLAQPSSSKLYDMTSCGEACSCACETQENTIGVG